MFNIWALYRFVRGAFVFGDVEKPAKNPQETETGIADQTKEEEEYEPLTGVGFNVSTNANQQVSATSGYRHLNTSNRHYNAGLRPANNWRRGGYEEWWSDKEQESRRDATVKHDGRRGSRRRLSTDDDRRYTCFRLHDELGY